MKCSLKDGFISVLLIIFIAPTKGADFSSFLHSSVLDKPLSFQQIRATMNRLQDLDSFPEICENQQHKIVKKQMAVSNYVKDVKKRKRSVLVVPDNFETFDRRDGDNVDVKVDGETEKAENSFDSPRRRREEEPEEEAFFEKLKGFVGRRKLDVPKKEENKKVIHSSSTTEDELTNSNKKLSKGNQKMENTEGKVAKAQENETEEEKSEQVKTTEVDEKIANSKEKVNKADEKPDTKAEEKVSSKEIEEPKKLNMFLAKKLNRIPDENDYRYYYECEENPIGCLKLRHKRCPNGQFFSNKYRKCLKVESFKMRRSADPKKSEAFPSDPTPEEPEPSNEWLDASQGVSQKVPSEFKPKKKPGLKIYHLRVKRKLNEMLRNEIYENHGLGRLSSPRVLGHRFLENPFRDVEKHKHHIPRSFIVRINKKQEGRGGQSITENDESESDEEDDDSEEEEEDDDDESEEEEEEIEEEEQKHSNGPEKPVHKESFRDMLKSAKEAVTNRARFEDPSRPGVTGNQNQKASATSKNKKSESAKEKKVLIDANIKVDSAFSTVLKSLLKDKSKEKESTASIRGGDDALISDRGSQDQLDPELLRVYEHLMRSNPRIKRYFLANRAKNMN